MKVLVKNTEIRTDSFMSKNDKEIIQHKQTVALDVGGDYPMPFSVDVSANQPYAIGEYSLAPESFRVGRFGGLEIDTYNVRLIPIVASAARKAS